jgi:hypothetical protein
MGKEKEDKKIFIHEKVVIREPTLTPKIVLTSSSTGG